LSGGSHGIVIGVVLAFMWSEIVVGTLDVAFLVEKFFDISTLGVSTEKSQNPGANFYTSILLYHFTLLGDC